MKRTLTLLVVVACILGGEDARAQTPADEHAIRQAIDAMTAAFNSRDDAATEAVATADADFVTVTGNRAKGAKAYTVARQKRFATALKHASIAPVETSVRFLKPDVALAHVTHEIRGMVDESGRALPPHRELSSRIFVKIEGKWLMTAPCWPPTAFLHDEASTDAVGDKRLRQLTGERMRRPPTGAMRRHDQGRVHFFERSNGWLGFLVMAFRLGGTRHRCMCMGRHRSERNHEVAETRV